MRFSSSLLITVLLALLLQSSLFIVQESERGIKARLGQLQTQNKVITILQPGLHFKIPFVDEVHVFDGRTLLLPIAADRIPTLDKKDVTVELYVKYRIEDFGLFYKRTLSKVSGRFERADALLKQSTTNILRATFGGKYIPELIRDGRLEVMKTIKEGVSKSALQYGISVVDIRIKRLDLPLALSEAVHLRMRTERKKEATGILAQGEAQANKMRAEAEQQRQIILASAGNQANQILGEAEAKAAILYAESYNRSPEFYTFFRSLEAYKKSFDEKQDVLVLSPKNEYFKYLQKNVTLKHD